jgi:hypothetical protein
MKINFNLLQLLLIIILLNLSCKKSPTEYIDNIEPGRRDYVWTIDTIDTIYPTYKIWGSSPTDLWTISSPGDFSRTIFHFDGNKWSTDGISRFFDPHSIYGFSRNEVYIGGLNGQILKFDGSNWNQIAELNKECTDYIGFENIWGESANDFYAVGSGPDNNGYFNISVIVHFINGNWKMIDTGSLLGDVVHLYKNHTDDIIYLQVIKIGGAKFPDSTLIYEYNGIRYNKLYSSVETKGLLADINLINNEVYFILGNEIALRRNNQFQTLFKINNPNFYQRIWGRNYKDIFLLMTDGLAHYNGSDVEYIFYFNVTPRTQVYGAALFEKEVFFTVYEDITKLKLIYHGKIKE